MGQGAATPGRNHVPDGTRRLHALGTVTLNDNSYEAGGKFHIFADGGLIAGEDQGVIAKVPTCARAGRRRRPVRSTFHVRVLLH